MTTIQQPSRFVIEDSKLDDIKLEDVKLEDQKQVDCKQNQSELEDDSDDDSIEEFMEYIKIYIAETICGIVIASVYAGQNELNNFVIMQTIFAFFYKLTDRDWIKFPMMLALLGTYIYGSRLLTEITDYNGLYFYSFAILVVKFYRYIFGLAWIVISLVILLSIQCTMRCMMYCCSIIDESSIIRVSRMRRNAVRRLRTGIVEVDAKVLAEGDACSICLDNYKPGDETRILNCNHIFHKKCCDGWIALHDTCPICRADICAERKSQPVNVAIDIAA